MTEKNVVTAIRDALHDEMAADDRIVLLGEDVGARGGVFRVSEGWMDEFGEERVIDTPSRSPGSWASRSGWRCTACSRSPRSSSPTSSIPAFDQIVSEAARMRYRSNGDFGVPDGDPRAVRRRDPRGALPLAVHRGVLRPRAGAQGRDAVDARRRRRAALRAAIHDPDPGLFLEHKKTYRAIKGEVPDGQPFEVPIGVADVKREGTDLTAVTYGYEVHRCLEAAQRLQDDEGISVEVVDVRTLAPLDVETILASVRKTGKAIVVYEDNRSYGAGAEIAATIAEEAMFDLDAPIVRIGGPDIPAMPFATALEHFFIEPQPDHIYRAMLELARS